MESESEWALKIATDLSCAAYRTHGDRWNAIAAEILRARASVYQDISVIKGMRHCAEYATKLRKLADELDGGKK